MSGEELAQRMHERSVARGSSESIDFYRTVAHIIECNELKVTMSSYTPEGGLILLVDANDRSVGAYEVTTTDRITRCQRTPFSDILILVEQGMVLGWTNVRHVRALEDEDPGFSLNARSIHPMNKVFEFFEPCPHLTVHGGYFNTDEGGWVCYGCDEVITDAFPNRPIPALKG